MGSGGRRRVAVPGRAALAELVPFVMRPHLSLDVPVISLKVATSRVYGPPRRIVLRQARRALAALARNAELARSPVMKKLRSAAIRRVDGVAERCVQFSAIPVMGRARNVCPVVFDVAGVGHSWRSVTAAPGKFRRPARTVVFLGRRIAGSARHLRKGA